MKMKRTRKMPRPRKRAQEFFQEIVRDKRARDKEIELQLGKLFQIFEALVLSDSISEMEAIVPKLRKQMKRELRKAEHEGCTQEDLREIEIFMTSAEHIFKASVREIRRSKGQFEEGLTEFYKILSSKKPT